MAGIKLENINQFIICTHLRLISYIHTSCRYWMTYWALSWISRGILFPSEYFFPSEFFVRSWISLGIYFQGAKNRKKWCLNSPGKLIADTNKFRGKLFMIIFAPIFKTWETFRGKFLFMITPIKNNSSSSEKDCWFTKIL